MNPIFLSSSTHKYDAWDHFKVDDTFGGDEALKDLIKEAHSRNMKVVLDCSLNHVHPRHFCLPRYSRKGENQNIKTGLLYLIIPFVFYIDHTYTLILTK